MEKQTPHQAISVKSDEVTTLNNMSKMYDAQGDYGTP